MNPQFEIGRIYNRRDEIHAAFGGQQQGGISTPNGEPFILLFTGESGEQFGYRDGWDSEGVFVYTGEGQAGDMEFIRGNRAVRDHAADGKTLELFQSLGKSKGCQYIGRFACASWENRQGKDVQGAIRKTIVFHLVRLDDINIGNGESSAIGSAPITDLKRRAYDAAREASFGKETDARRVIYERSEAVRSYVLARAGGQCESCGKVAPFTRKDGTPYLEPHHTRRVADGGPDHPMWVGAVCPNCHREIHFGLDGEAKNASLERVLAKLEGGR